MRWLTAATMAFLIGCGGSSGPPPIYLGHVVSSAAAERDATQQATLGIRLAILELAKEDVKVFGRPVQAIHTDTRGDLEAFESEAVRLTKINKAPALYGGQSAAEVQRLERARVPVLTPASLVPGQLAENAFSVGLSPAVRGQALARFLAEQPDVGSIVAIVDQRLDDAQVVVTAFQRELAKDAAAKAPALVVLNVDKQTKAADVAQKIRATKPAAVLFAGSAPDLFAWRGQETAWPPLILFAGPDGSLRARDMTEPVIVATAFAVDPELPSTEQLAKKFREVFQVDAEVQAALAYDAVRMLVHALKESESGEPLIEELKKISDFAGLTGPLTFGAERTLRRSAFVVRMEGGKTALLKRVPPHN